MEKLVITAACDSSVSYPRNDRCLPATRENATAIGDEYVRCIDAGAAITHLHGVRQLEAEIQEDGRRLSRIDYDGWAEMTERIRAQRDSIIQFGIAGARIEDREPLLAIKPEMMSVAFNSHDEYFQPDPEYPPNCIYSLHPTEELRQYARLFAASGVKLEVEVFQPGAIWNLKKLLSEGLIESPPWASLFLGWEGGTWMPPDEESLIYLSRQLPEGTNFNVSVMDPQHQWKLLTLAIGLGGHVRVGAEDNPFIRPGELASSNAELVEKIVSIAGHMGREIASPEEARKIIGLEGPSTPAGSGGRG